MHLDRRRDRLSAPGFKRRNALVVVNAAACAVGYGYKSENEFVICAAGRLHDVTRCNSEKGERKACRRSAGSGGLAVIDRILFRPRPLHEAQERRPRRGARGASGKAHGHFSAASAHRALAARREQVRAAFECRRQDVRQ